MLFCKNCKKNCSDVEGDFGCLGLPDKTTIEDILARVNELLCEDCGPPQINVDSSCGDNKLVVTLVDKGNAEKVTIEIYQRENLYRTLRVNTTGLYEFEVPFGDYRIRAYNTYNFDCSTAFSNYRHQCVGQECVKPIITLNPRFNPPVLNVNILSLGETSTIELKIYRENTLVNTRTINSITSFDIPASSGVYTVSYVAKCGSGDFVSDEYKVVFPENDCDIVVAGFSYDCSTNDLNLNITGGSLAYQYSVDQLTWVDSLSSLQIQPLSFYNLYIRDKNNTSCVTYYQFNTLCKCQLSFEVSEIQCNQLNCQITFTYSEVQCSNTLICVVNGVIQPTN